LSAHEASHISDALRSQEVRYSMVPEPLGEAAEWLAGVPRAGTSWLSRLRSHLLPDRAD
jgi:hypothetical protein